LFFEPSLTLFHALFKMVFWLLGLFIVFLFFSERRSGIASRFGAPLAIRHPAEPGRRPAPAGKLGTKSEKA
jgi:hypothetical protein